MGIPTSSQRHTMTETHRKQQQEQVAIYGQYHTNKVNVGIHILCVPTIFWTFLVLFNKVFPWHFTVPLLYGPLKTDLIVNVPFLIATGYALYFIGLEPVAGTAYAPWIIFQGWSANYVYANYGATVAGWLFGAAWIAQFIGHGKYEGRAPALLDSLFQSLVLAVFFVFMEVLFMAGYRPELHKRLQNRIGKEVLAYRQAKKREGKPDMKATDQQTVWRG